MPIDRNKEFNAAPAPQKRRPGASRKLVTLHDLIAEYQIDPASSYHELRYSVRRNHDTLLRRLAAEHGAVKLSKIRIRDAKLWHKAWTAGGKLSTGHAMIAQLRVLASYGAMWRENDECARLTAVFRLKTPAPPPREEFMTLAQCVAFIAQAHEWGWHSMARAQAFQFETMFRQKDIIGEYVPLNEPGESDVQYMGEKWLRGIRWEEIDANLTLRHTTSKRGKKIAIDLKSSPLVLDELAFIGFRPDRGPVIVCEATALPYRASEYRRKWRLVATAAGIPKEIRSQDTRAGAITEATEAGAELEHVKHAATHSDISMTQRYSRNAADKIASVQAKRLEHRNRTNQ